MTVIKIRLELQQGGPIFERSWDENLLATVTLTKCKNADAVTNKRWIMYKIATKQREVCLQ